MWTIIKIDQKRINFLKKDFEEKLGKDYIIYCPKLSVEKFKKNKLVKKEFNLLGDYLLCFHEDFSNQKTMTKLKFCRGLKYFLNGFQQYQNDIQDFIKRCKSSENEKGYLSSTYFELNLNQKYKFSSGPFSEKIFQIINLQKNKIDILMGNIKTTIKQKEFLFSPI